MRDIETREDCERLVRVFYGRALEDPIIGFLFTDVAKLDLEAHVPRITAFWETILVGGRTYAGGAFRPHADLHLEAPLRRAHFDQWLNLWTTTVDELFAGERAELAKAHAVRVARAFHQRLQSLPSAAAPGGLVVTHHRPQAPNVNGGWVGERGSRPRRPILARGRQTTPGQDSSTNPG